MTDCKHQNLELLPGEKNRFRCRHCHLAITTEELGGSYCPECYETQGKRRYDFEEIEAAKTVTARYRCEECNALIKTQPEGSPK